MITIYHNSRCKKSRAGLQFLSDKTSDFEIKEYLKEDAFTIESLNDTLNLLGKKPMEMIRKQEDVFKKEIKGKEFSDEQLIELMVKNPKLIQRPIIIKDGKAVWGDPAENIEELF
ncbi:arsenate reductase family protein [Lentimicrobium sp. S6]|uniref:arsenate reductase family protein n=1 Tax=Lentimicrobium sp. S6 TaxID=2735872 RepID=UPI001552C919|nr:arsenate reductase family protein [Lentimicrobium sp. S6]NPD47968.1 arsenate reductase family protein [Lentimicrobium sp. S6]